ncbi:MAG: AmmeMemoRadiSam system protein A, partial [Caldiserica bacterium]|nr:AmmeMemoRadiSam system protein A [Caldisericota bacterium]
MSELSQEDKQFLLKVARETIQAKLENRAPRLPELHSPILKENRGVFVTLKKEGELRGCIGYIFPLAPLKEAVQKMALASAFEDPRFPPLTREEFPRITIEISVLSPLRKIKSIQEFNVGTHGIYLAKGPYSAVFLPQVAPEQGWDRETTLKYLSLKAGLPGDGWKDAQLSVFT